MNSFYGADDTNFANQANEALQFDPQHVATYGPGGTRIGQFSKKAEMPFTKFIENCLSKYCQDGQFINDQVGNGAQSL